jgi:hypothetical protein
MHANFHSFLVTQLFTEWFAIHTHIMWFHDVSHFAKLKHSDGEAAPAPRTPQKLNISRKPSSNYCVCVCV